MCLYMSICLCIKFLLLDRRTQAGALRQAGALKLTRSTLRPMRSGSALWLALADVLRWRANAQGLGTLKPLLQKSEALCFKNLKPFASKNLKPFASKI